MKYEFTKDMTEISGFGGEYEQACRRMLAAGCRWLDDHSSAHPQFKSFRNVYGVAINDNDDAKALSAAVVEAAGEFRPSGVMHHAVISALLFIKAKGWNEYVKMMTHPEGEVGILREALKDKTEQHDRLQERLRILEDENARRGRIIAEAVLEWKTYGIKANGEQRVYAPDQATADTLSLGDKLSRFVDEVIGKMK